MHCFLEDESLIQAEKMKMDTKYQTFARVI